MDDRPYGLKWWPLLVSGGAHNAKVRDDTRNASGAYAIRAPRGSIVYVGASQQGVMWKTITRHFNAPATFKAPKPKGGGNAFAVGDAHGYEVAYKVTSRGHRTLENKDTRAFSLEGRWIAKFLKAGEPLKNDEVPAAAGTKKKRKARASDDDFAFGANVKNPDVPTERRAENRTPDLFTGKTKAEEGGKARRDWKGDAERAQRELAECRRAAPSTPARSKADLPAKKPEGFGEVDEKGQAGMFRRNPPGPTVLGFLVAIAYRADDGRRRTMRWGLRDAPLVAYDPAKATASLLLIFGPRYAGPSSSAGQREYRRTHWGKTGDGDRLAGTVLGGSARRLGVALEITYATSKRGDGPRLVDYWHTFGDLGPLALKRPFIPPALLVATVGGRELARLDGGTYKVTAHGIVG